MSVASEFERQMLDLINQERTSRGLDPLTLELRLNDASEDHTLWMDRTGNFSHTGAGGSNPGDRMRDADFVFSGNWTWGENIAFQSERGAPGISDDVEDLHESLMNSPGHRANILNPNFEVVGIGIELGNGRGFDAVYVTQNFARTSADLQLDLPDAPPPPPPPQDPLDGTNANDQITGTGAADVVTGLRGRDTIMGGDGNDRLDGGRDRDRMSGDDGNDWVNGGRGHDRVGGGNGNDTVLGGAGNDLLNGGRGNDRIDGGTGDDRMMGKTGADVFVFSAGNDVVLDFNPDKRGEKIILRTADSITDFADLTSDGHLKRSGQDTVIDDLNGNTMRLVGVEIEDLAANDFIF